MNNRGSFMTMAVIFLWPRWGVRSYPIVTRVTSDVGIPSTRLVDIHNCRIYSHWLSIPNQIVIAGYLAVAEYQICFHFIVWVVRSRPHMNVSNSFLLLCTATCVSYITEYEPCTWHHVAHLVFYLNLRIYIYGNKRLIVSDADSLTFIAQSPEECVRCIWNLFCYRVWFHEQYTT